MITNRAHNISFSPNAVVHTVIEDFSFPQEFAMVSMDYLDRFLSRCTDLSHNKDQVQLLALSSFYLAVKLFQAGPVLSTQQIAIISGGTYTHEQVSAMEHRMLFTLNWKLHPPCSADFLRPFLMIFLYHNVLTPLDPINADILDMALRMLHTSVLDYFFVAHRFSKSHIAAAALMNAVQIIMGEEENNRAAVPPSPMEMEQVLCSAASCRLVHADINVIRERLWRIFEPVLSQPPAKAMTTANVASPVLSPRAIVHCPQQQHRIPPTGWSSPNSVFEPPQPPLWQQQQQYY